MKTDIDIKRYLNEKIYFTDKNITDLTTYFGTNSALFLASPNNNITKVSEYRNLILQYVGSQIIFDFQKNTKKTFITSAYNLKKVDKIIHCILPKYSDNFAKSALDSLHFAYRELYEITLDNDINTIIIGEDIINPNFDNNYELNKSIEIFIRTTRKILEQFNHNINKIIFNITKDEIFNALLFYLKVYFPRNENEKQTYRKYIPNIPIGIYGDLITNYNISKIKEQITDKPNNELLYNYNDLNGLSFLQQIYYEDSDRLNIVYDDKIYYYKQFYYKNIKNYSIELKGKFEDLNFISFKGTDESRQIFFFYLKLIDWSQMEEMQIDNLLLIYCYQYFKDNYILNKNLSLIFFCNGLENKNFPSKDFLEKLQKILLSLIALKTVDFNHIQIIFFLPDFFFKMFLGCLKLFITNEVSQCIKNVESYDEINDLFYLGLDPDNDIRINSLLDRNVNFYEDVRNILNSRNDLNITDN